MQSKLDKDAAMIGGVAITFFCVLVGVYQAMWYGLASWMIAFLGGSLS